MVQNHGPLSMNYGLLYGIVAYHFWLLGFPGTRCGLIGPFISAPVRIHPLDASLPKGARYPIFKVSGPRNHTLNGVLGQGP